MSRVYLDTSAYLCVLLGDTKAPVVMKLLAKKEVCSNVFLFLESERNLIRLSREKALTPDECSDALMQLQKDRELFISRDLTSDLCLNSEYPPIRVPRSSDLVHLRTAKWFQQNGGLESFITLDKHQRQCAVDMGLHPVEL